MDRKVDKFTQQYMITALWSSNDESTPEGGEPMDKNYNVSDIADETFQKMKDDCEKFQRENEADLLLAYDQYPQRGDDWTGPEGSAGHDFWLTRNGHGAGFWDGDLERELGERLTAAAKKFGETNLCVDDGKIHFM